MYRYKGTISFITGHEPLYAPKPKNHTVRVFSNTELPALTEIRQIIMNEIKSNQKKLLDICFVLLNRFQNLEMIEIELSWYEDGHQHSITISEKKI